jgi:heme a synthase
MHPSSSSPPAGHRWLGHCLWLSVAILYVVILAGAVVRASGSGMGCPDWPRCFGRLIPPTALEQIPAEYMQKFLTDGHGNLFHTWIEFLNRIVGALSGLAIAATFCFALVLGIRSPQPGLRRDYLRVAAAVFAGLVLFILVAWLGKIVVNTTLAPAKITLHMIAGLILLSTAIYGRLLISTAAKAPLSPRLRWALLGLLALTACQIVLGTQVREMVDHLPEGACCDARLEPALAPWFSWHWAGALLTTLGTAAFTWASRKSPAAATLGAWRWLPLLLLAMEYGLGVLLVRLGLSPLLRPFHLLMATFILGSWLVLWHSTKAESA